MVFSHSLEIIILASSLFFISLLPQTTLSQTTPATSSPPTMAECGPRLLPLAPCAPFVQGQSPGPTQLCCDNLKQVYDEQRGCVCLFLNGTALASLPINSTLALQLPALCSPQIDPSTCSSASKLSSRNNPRTAAAPTVTAAPGPSTAKLDLEKNSACKLMTGGKVGALVAVIPLLFAILL